VLEFGGAQYMVRGLGYLRSLDDLRTVPVATKGRCAGPGAWTSVTSTFGPYIRQGVADWNGRRETVGGIVVMRDGKMNALDVINGVKAKWAGLRRPSRRRRGRHGVRPVRTDSRVSRDPGARSPRIEIVYCQPRESRLPLHVRSALFRSWTLPVAVLACFIPNARAAESAANIMSLGGSRLASAC